MLIFCFVQCAVKMLQRIILRKVFVITCILCHSVIASNQKPFYINKWAVEIDGDDNTANEVAAAQGFVNLGKVSESR